MGLGAAGVSLHIPHTLRFWAAQPEPAGMICVPVSARVPSAALGSRYCMQHKHWLKKQIPDVFLALECPESSCTALQTQPVSNVFNTIHSQLFLPLSAHSRKPFLCIHPSKAQCCEEWGPGGAPQKADPALCSPQFHRREGLHSAQLSASRQTHLWCLFHLTPCKMSQTLTS